MYMYIHACVYLCVYSVEFWSIIEKLRGQWLLVWWSWIISIGHICQYASHHIDSYIHVHVCIDPVKGGREEGREGGKEGGREGGRWEMRKHWETKKQIPFALEWLTSSYYYSQALMRFLKKHITCTCTWICQTTPISLLYSDNAYRHTRTCIFSVTYMYMYMYMYIRVTVKILSLFLDLCKCDQINSLWGEPRK